MLRARALLACLLVPSYFACSSGAGETQTSDSSLGGANHSGASRSGGNTSTGSQSSGGANGGASSGGSSAIPTLPKKNAAFDYQIGGAYEPPLGVSVVSRDRTSAIAQGLYNICYVNGFQTQPDEESFWLDEHPELVLRDGSNMPIVDENWGEMLLDTSTNEKRNALLGIVSGFIDSCVSAGFDAVEIDNLDSYSRSTDLLDEDDNVAFIALLADYAHGKGLAIAQKNSAELLPRKGEMKTDFAVTEQCAEWDECGDFSAAYGGLVFDIEYEDTPFDDGCAAHPDLSFVLRDLDVSTPGSGTYVYEGC